MVLPFQLVCHNRPQVAPSSQGAPVSSMAVEQDAHPSPTQLLLHTLPPETSAQPDWGKWLRSHSGEGPSPQPTGQVQPLHTPRVSLPGECVLTCSHSSTAGIWPSGQSPAPPAPALLSLPLPARGELEQLVRLIPVYLLGEQTF